MVKLRLKRMGAKRRPYYRIVVADSRTPRDGRPIAEIGYYHPVEKDEDRQILVREELAKEWLLKGAQPTPVVKRLLNKKGVSFK